MSGSQWQHTTSIGLLAHSKHAISTQCGWTHTFSMPESVTPYLGTGLAMPVWTSVVKKSA